jgi:hypothetical protein
VIYSARQVTVLRSLAPELAISFEDLLWLGFFYRVPPKARAPLGGIGRRAGGRAHAAAADRCHLARRGAAGLSRRNRVPQVRKAAVELLIELYLDTGAANPDMVGSSAENVLTWCAMAAAARREEMHSCPAALSRSSRARAVPLTRLRGSAIVTVAF